MNVEFVALAIAMSVFVIFAVTTTELIQLLSGRSAVPSGVQFLVRDLPPGLLPRPVTFVVGLLIAGAVQVFVLYIVMGRASELSSVAALVLWGEIAVAAAWATWLLAHVRRSRGRERT